MEFIKKTTKEVILIGKRVVLDGKQSENSQKIQKLWQFFNKSLWKIKNRFYTDQWVKYGMTYDSIAGKQYAYMAAVEVTDILDIPAGMIGKKIPPLTMMVVHHRGTFARLNQTYNKLYNKEIPSAPWRQANPDNVGFKHYEKYDHRFKWTSPDSLIEIAIPVEE